jgi:hypothetical protein
MLLGLYCSAGASGAGGVGAKASKLARGVER